MAESNETAQRLAIVCAKAENIRQRLCSLAGSDTLLEELLAAARSGGEIAEPVDVLHAVLQGFGDAQGLYAYSDSGRTGDRSVRAGGTNRECSPELVYLCPAARCTRSWWPQGPVPVPRCAISGDTLRRDRL
ncbi:hypothetical protein AS594_39750 [Streptomyces agglomeratus]|uniref:Uncharacterized protein n=1 Tax=Streptomyces agglomeratus TaxID=285458 RepID=A0A1E5NZA8_9ACTN|nr:hypothetical protein AS594_39750 [Streptomyces agglomeratus]